MYHARITSDSEDSLKVEGKGNYLFKRTLTPTLHCKLDNHMEQHAKNAPFIAVSSSVGPKGDSNLVLMPQIADPWVQAVSFTQLPQPPPFVAWRYPPLSVVPFQHRDLKSFADVSSPDSWLASILKAA